MNQTNLRRMLGLFVIILGIVAIGRAAEGTKVDKVARAGYWGDDDNWAEHAKLIGKPAPELTLTAPRIGIPTAAMRKGKVVVVDFWATWCKPCRDAVPHNNEIAKKYADKGVLVIGACGGGHDENMWNVAEAMKFEYPTGHASDEVAKAWGVQWWPHYVVIDREGIVRAAGVRPDALEKVIDAVLEEAK